MYIFMSYLGLDKEDIKENFRPRAAAWGIDLPLQGAHISIFFVV
jgi:hypothetical protein